LFKHKIFQSTRSLFHQSPNTPGQKVAAVNSITELLFISVGSLVNYVSLPAENSRCENFPTGDSNYGKNEKENDNGTESFKSPPKIHHSSMVVLKTEEEMKYRHKYFNGKVEAGNYTHSQIFV
jgi:hypothetical protein